MANTINISDITSNVQVTTDNDGLQVVTGDGYFDDIMETLNVHLKSQFDNGYIKGAEYAQVYMTLFQNAMNQAMQFTLQKRINELQADGLEKDVLIRDKQLEKLDEEIDLLQTQDSELLANGLKARELKDEQIASAHEDVLKKVEDNSVATALHDTKVSQGEQQLLKLQADTSYVAEQEVQLINSVNYNNKIKAIDSLSDTYGVFGGGGLTVSSDMWATYFGLINDLADGAIPTSTTVTKVT